MLGSLIDPIRTLGALVRVQDTVFAEELCMSCCPSAIHRSRGKETGFANRAIEKG